MRLGEYGALAEFAGVDENHELGETAAGSGSGWELYSERGNIV